MLWVLWNTSKSSFNVTFFVTSSETASSFSLKYSPSWHVPDCTSIVPNEDTVIPTVSYCFNYSTFSTATFGFFVALSALLAGFLSQCPIFLNCSWVCLITWGTEGGNAATGSALGRNWPVGTQWAVAVSLWKTWCDCCYPSHTYSIYILNFGSKSLPQSWSSKQWQITYRRKRIQTMLLDTSDQIKHSNWKSCLSNYEYRGLSDSGM